MKRYGIVKETEPHLPRRWVPRCGTRISTGRQVWFLCRWDQWGNREDLTDGRGNVRYWPTNAGCVRFWEKLTGFKAQWLRAA